MTGVTEIMSGLKDIVLMAGEIVGIFAVGALVGLIGALRRQKANSKWSRTRERKFVEKHSTIHELLTELRITTRASRALVFQFHNGGSFVDGGSIKRFSLTHESCEMGVTSVILDSQDVLLTRYTDMISIMDNSTSKIIEVGSMPQSPFRSALEINNVEFFSINPLRCSDGITPLGFLCCHWCSGEQIEEIEKEGVSRASVQQIIFETSQSINSYLAHSTGSN